MKNFIYYLVAIIQLILVFTILLLYFTKIQVNENSLAFPVFIATLLSLISLILLTSGKNIYKNLAVSITNVIASFVLLIIIIINLAPDGFLNKQSGYSQIIASLLTGGGAIGAAIIGYTVIHQHENSKRDRELIQSLNERYTSIISELNQTGQPLNENLEKESIYINKSFYFLALVSLYKDWDALSDISPLVAAQKKVQQRFIIKTIFNSELSKSEGKYANSAVDEIFPDKDTKTNSLIALDISNINLSNLEINGKNFSQMNLQGSSVKNVKFSNCTFDKTIFSGAEALEHIEFYKCDFNDVDFNENYLDLTFDSSKINNSRFKANERCLNNRFINTDFDSKCSIEVISGQNNSSISNNNTTLNPNVRRKNKTLNQFTINKDDFFKFEGNVQNMPTVEII